MKHARADYNRIQDPEKKIPADEPVFLLRAQDPDAAETVRLYADLVAKRGATSEMVNVCREHAVLMDTWPVKKDVADL